MKYLVIESRLSYAVVIDEQGRFRKVANLNYEVGQTVREVFEMEIPKKSFFTPLYRKTFFTGMVAVVLMFIVFFTYPRPASFATVVLQINPEVKISLNQERVVQKVDGNNPEGKALIAGYIYQDKRLDLVVDELVDLAIDQGYLYEGGQIELTFDSKNQEWLIQSTKEMSKHLSESMQSKPAVTIIVKDSQSNKQEVVIPVTPPQSEDSGYTDYDESDYSPTQPIEPTPTPTPTPSPTPTPVPPVDDSDYDDQTTRSRIMTTVPTMTIVLMTIVSMKTMTLILVIMSSTISILMIRI